MLKDLEVMYDPINTAEFCNTEYQGVIKECHFHISQLEARLLRETDRYRDLLLATDAKFIVLYSLLLEAKQTIQGLADQQAMTDDFWKETVNRIDEKLEKK